MNALNDVLSGLKVWCNTALVGSALGNRLRRSLLELFLELTASPHGPLARGVGPLDAQICFVEMLLKLGIQGLDTQLSVSIVSSIGNGRSKFKPDCVIVPIDVVARL